MDFEYKNYDKKVNVKSSADLRNEALAKRNGGKPHSVTPYGVAGFPNELQCIEIIQVRENALRHLKIKHPNLDLENEVKLINDKVSKLSNNDRKVVLYVHKWRNL